MAASATPSVGTIEGVQVPVVPVGIAYSQSLALPCARGALHLGAPMHIQGEGREAPRVVQSAP